MARNLAAKGFLATVWNRTVSRAVRLAEELGVAVAGSPGDLAQQVEVIVLCVAADADVLEVVEALLPALRPGTIVVDFSTVSRETACEAARRVRARGGDFLDAPVTGGVEGAIQGRLAIMVGGSAASLGRVEPLLRAVGSQVVHLGDIGMGQAAKAVNQVMCAGINQAVTEALAFGERLGLDLDKVIEVVSGGAAGNWFLDRRGRTMIRDHYAPGFRVALHQKDLRICLAMAEALGFPLETAAMTVRDYATLISEGFGDEDISALYRVKSGRLREQ